MEIRCLEQAENVRTRALYEDIFTGDEKAFVDAYYAIKAKDNRILAAEDEGRLVSMLHRNPYAFRLRGKVVPADYIVAVATLPEYRHQGLMRCLLTKALQDMYEERLPFTFLMPADEAIYTPFDFRWMGNEDGAELAALSPEQLSETYDLYVEKNALYEQRHIDWPEWETTPMMMRLVHLPAFMEQIGAREAQKLIVAIEDRILPANNGTFCWELEKAGSRLTSTRENPEITFSIAELGRFLFGKMKAEELAEDCFAGNRTEVLEKLNRIAVLRKKYINETV